MSPVFPTHIQGPVLWILFPTCLVTLTGLSPFNARRSRRLQIPKQQVLLSPNTTLHFCCQNCFGLAFAVFTRRY